MKPRLLIFSTEFPPGPGGIGTHAYALALYFSKNEWSVRVLTPQDYVSDGEVRRFNASQPFSVQRLQHIAGTPTEGVYRLGALWDMIRRWQPDVVLATGERSVWLMAALAPFVRIPWVAVGHGTEFGVTKSLKRVLTRWAFSRADAVICVSEFTRKQMEGLGVRPRRTFVIPNGADAERFKPIPQEATLEWRRRYGLEHTYILLTVGSVTERKGQDIVIRALPKVVKEFPHVHYVLVGLPFEAPRYNRLAEDLGVADHVHFLGRLNSDDLVKAYNAADLFVLTSRYTRGGDFEGYGIAVIEAALCGVPAVVSNSAGLKEAVVDGVTGLIVPEEDPAATADAIIRLLRMPMLHREIARAARDKALRESTWEARGHLYEQVLFSLLRLS